MLNTEEKLLLERLEQNVRKLQEDFESGIVTQEEYNAKCKMVHEALDKIEAISAKEK